MCMLKKIYIIHNYFENIVVICFVLKYVLTIMFYSLKSKCINIVQNLSLLQSCSVVAWIITALNHNGAVVFDCKCCKHHKWQMCHLVEKSKIIYFEWELFAMQSMSKRFLLVLLSSIVMFPFPVVSLQLYIGLLQKLVILGLFCVKYM